MYRNAKLFKRSWKNKLKNFPFNDMNSLLTHEQRMVHAAMFLDPKMIPSFPPSTETIRLGETIKKMYDQKVLTKMYLDEHGAIHCE